MFHKPLLSTSPIPFVNFGLYELCRPQVRKDFLEENPVLSELWQMLENLDIEALNEVDWDGKFAPYRNISYQV